MSIEKDKDNLYEKNIEGLKNYNIFLYEELETYLEKGFEESNIKIENIETKDGFITYNIEYHSREARLNSLYNQKKEAERWAEQYRVTKANQVIICYGLGNGIFVKELLKGLQPDTVLILIEPNEGLLIKALHDFDFNEILQYKMLQLFVGENCEEAYSQALELTINWANADSVLFINHPQYDWIFEDEYKKYFKIYNDYRNLTIVNHMTNLAISKTNSDNLMNNLAFIPKSSIITEITSCFNTNLPAIIVSAGPSLDKNINELKNLHQNAYIIAVDTAVKYLLSQDILPDIIVTLDPDKWPEHLTDPRCFSIPLFCRVESNPVILRNFEQLVFFNIEGYLETLLTRAGRKIDKCNSGGSVTTGAFSVCITLGFKEIILIGSDLAYLNNMTHAGSLSVDVGNTARYLEKVEDIFGNMIQTRYDWYIYLKWLEDAISRFSEVHVTDATEGGAKIHGSEIRTLKETVEKINSTIKQSKYSMSFKKLPVKEILLDVKEDIKTLHDIETRLRDNIKYTQELIAVPSGRKKLLGKVSYNNNWIERQDIYLLIDWDIVYETSEDMKEIINDGGKSLNADLEAFKKSLKIYQAMLDAAERFLPKLQELAVILTNED